MKENVKRPLEKKPFNWRTLIWVMLAWLLLIYFFQGRISPTPAARTISYTEFKQAVKQGRVTEVTLKGNEITGKFRQTQSGVQESAPVRDKSFFRIFQNSKSQTVYFKTTKPDLQDPELLALLEKNGVTIHAETQQRSWWTTLLITFLPWLLILGLIFYGSKKMQERMMGGGRGGGIFGFSKSKAKLFDKKSIAATYRDVAGLDNAKKELQEVKEYLKDPAKFQRLGGELPKGLLLVGPPGVGKTLLAQATAGEADVPFYSISGSEFIEMFVGVGASRVRDMFKKAKKDAPAIIFIDEIDSIGRVRGSGLGGGHDEREQTLNQILAEMDGFSPHQSVVVMAATNRPDVLDPALIRPGRFDRRITLDLPQKKARLKILETHTREVPLADEVDLENLAQRTPGLSGADLKNIVNEAALLAARKNKQQVDTEDFEQSRDKILMGLEREDVIKDEDKKLIACHEAGHALLAKLLPGADPLQKVTIIPRGQSLGATEQIPEKERHNIKRSYLLNRLAIMLGGRAAEKIMFEDVSTGAADDLKKATELVRRMVCQWGMSDKIGPVTFRRGETHPFLGRELTESRDFSEHTARLIDEEIQAIVVNMEKKAHETLADNRDSLEALTDQLLEHETLTEEKVDDILKETAGTANYIGE
ncbi:MAG: ATP-dependent zinc metalloprotease FtsH [Desulfobacterales bacterium]|jgi:cell division protease FtsH